MNHKVELPELHGNEGCEVLEFCNDSGNNQKMLQQILDRIQLYKSNKKIKKLSIFD